MNLINIPAILIANLMGIVILFVIAVGDSWQIKQIFKNDKSIMFIYISCLVSCIADPICFIADGRSGSIYHFLVFWCNMVIFICNIVNIRMFVKSISTNTNTDIPLIPKVLINIGTIICSGLLIANLFMPTVFYVDNNNVYHRAGFFGAITVFYILMLVYCLAFYFLVRHRSGNIKHFPVWAFVIPVSIGMAIQTFFYGISTIIPFTTVSLICLYICLQSEYIYRDKLTGLYNRFFLDKMKNGIKKTDSSYVMMMFDINGFKKINDTYGHSVGDEALIHTANIFRRIIGPYGEVVRYAGDEFIAVLNIYDDNVVEDVVSELHKAFSDISEKVLPYILSVSIGYCRADFVNSTFSEIMTKIDKRMYENKAKYYQEHPRNDYYVCSGEAEL